MIDNGVHRQQLASQAAVRSKFIIFSLLLLALLALDVLVGSVGVSLADMMEQGSVAQHILLDFRLPKAAAALLSGVALSASGLLMQTIFRNPLAGPYVLGVSSGASLGVAIFLLGAPLFGIGIARDMGVALAAWIGAAAILLVVMAVSSRIKNIMAVLILGMMFGSAAGAFVDVLQYFSSEAALKGFVIWAMGSLGGVANPQLVILALCVLTGVVLSVIMIKPLNIMLLGESQARTMGVNTGRVRWVVFLATSLLAGGVTAFCGPIAFVGIAVPHIARMVFRSADHSVLLPASMILGADMMLMCDIISQLPGSDMTLPINTITAIFGIPIVVLVVINSRRS